MALSAGEQRGSGRKSYFASRSERTAEAAGDAFGECDS
ncbi:hypothetical protein NJ7G_1922 [Natrinema sp. J7-2]|nr:hypothetical protein NJ7G_1922 [Natrinema sp. J7-2]